MKLRKSLLLKADRFSTGILQDIRKGFSAGTLAHFRILLTTGYVKGFEAGERAVLRDRGLITK